MGLTSTIGAKGEDFATSWLRKNGFYIRERNWRNGRYEIDIIAERWDTIHFIEVKTRSVNGWSSPEDAITINKFNSLKRAATAYLAFFGITSEFQFDLIAIDVDSLGEMKLRYIENAMESRW